MISHERIERILSKRAGYFCLRCRYALVGGMPEQPMVQCAAGEWEASHPLATLYADDKPADLLHRGDCHHGEWD